MKTPVPKFVLKDAKGSKPSLIYLIARFGELRFKYSTSETILPALWDFKNQIPSTDKDLIKRHNVMVGQLTDIKNSLSNYSSLFIEIFENLKRSGQAITPEMLRDEFKKKFKPETIKEKPIRKDENLFTWIEHYSKNVKLNFNGEPIKPRTRKKYNTTLRHLKEFSEEKKFKVDFDTISKSFYEKFVSYMYTEKKFSKNTVGCYVAALKTMLYEAKVQGKIQTSDFENFKVPEEDVDKHYLTEDELLLLHDFDFSANRRLEKIRDMLLIACYTGLRFSDFSTIREENIYQGSKGEFIKKRMMKTNDFVVIPLHWIVKEILTKYDYILPVAISNQKFNSYLKEVCFAAGIDQLVEFKGKTVPKWKAISTHTGRRSFATNAYLAGIPSISIRKITGHRTETSFMRYIQISGEENAMHIQDHPFFQKTLRIA